MVENYIVWVLTGRKYFHCRLIKDRIVTQVDILKYKIAINAKGHNNFEDIPTCRACDNLVYVFSFLEIELYVDTNVLF